MLLQIDFLNHDDLTTPAVIPSECLSPCLALEGWESLSAALIIIINHLIRQFITDHHDQDHSVMHGYSSSILTLILSTSLTKALLL